MTPSSINVMKRMTEMAGIRSRDWCDARRHHLVPVTHVIYPQEATSHLVTCARHRDGFGSFQNEKLNNHARREPPDVLKPYGLGDHYHSTASSRFWPSIIRELCPAHLTRQPTSQHNDIQNQKHLPTYPCKLTILQTTGLSYRMSIPMTTSLPAKRGRAILG